MSFSKVGKLTELTDRVMIVDGDIIHHEYGDYKIYMPLIGEEVCVGVTEKDGKLFAVDVQPIMFTKTTSVNLNPESLVVDKDKTAFSDLTLDIAKIKEGEAVVETSYVAEQKKISSYKSTYYAFKLRVKDGRIIHANMFTEECPNLNGNIVMVSILRKDKFFNIIDIRAENNIVLKDPQAELCREFLINKTEALNDRIMNKEFVEGLLLLLRDENIIRHAYEINTILTYGNILDFDLKETVRVALFGLLKDIPVTTKKLLPEQVTSTVRLVSNMIHYKCFDISVLVYYTEDAEVQSREKVVLNMAIEQAARIYELQNTFSMEVR